MSGRLKFLVVAPPLLLAASALAATPSPIRPNVIYGTDNRLDLYEVQDARLLELAASTAMEIETRFLTPNGAYVDVQAKTYGDDYNLCKDERFYDQPDPGMCTAFVVGEDLLLTAGHCIVTQHDCDESSFVFGYGVTSPGNYPVSIPTADVYRCASIVKRKLENNGPDYALLRTDRKMNRKPLELERNSKLKPGDPVGVIGHPSGLPTKVTFGGIVRSTAFEYPAPVGYFRTNLDTYGGNSGSPVFNANTGLVEGILVRGEVDWKTIGTEPTACRVSKVCAADACRGEDVTKIAEIAPLIP